MGLFEKAKRRYLEFCEPPPPPGKVVMPDAWKTWNKDMGYIAKDDYRFVNQLLTTYSLRTATPGVAIDPHKAFGRTEFFSLIAETKNHMLRVRKDIDGDTTEADSQTLVDADAENNHFINENRRSSNQRLQELAILVLNIPQVKMQSRKLHVEKMERAYTEFTSRLPHLLEDTTPSPDTYITEAGKFISRSIVSNASALGPAEDLENVGLLLSYKLSRIRYPDSSLMEQFVTSGGGELIDKLQQIVAEAQAQGQDVAERVHHEFLDADGVVNQLMQVAITEFKPIGSHPLPEIRKRLLKSKHQRGRCPMYGKMGTFEGMDEETMTQVRGQQVAYTYADAIVKGMAKRGLLTQPSVALTA